MVAVRCGHAEGWLGSDRANGVVAAKSGAHRSADKEATTMTLPEHQGHASPAARGLDGARGTRAAVPGSAARAAKCAVILALAFAAQVLPLPRAWGAGGAPVDVAVEDARAVLLPRQRGRWAGYLTLRNNGQAPALLLGASTPLAARVEIHETATESPAAPDRRWESVVVPPGGAVSFGPGGLYLALFDPVMGLRGGDRFPLTLRFDGGDVTAVLSVDAVGGSPLGEGPFVVPDGTRSP